MASTYTTRGRLEKQADGENDSTWGDKVNVVFDLVDEWRGGYEAVSVAGGVDVTLTTTDGASDQVRQAVIEFTGLLTANINVIVPTRENIWLFKNSTSGAYTLTVKTAAGTGIAITQGSLAFLYCDGTNVCAGIKTADYLLAASNLSDLASASTARTNLGLGTIATQAANSVTITGGTLAGTTITSSTITLADNVFTLQDNLDVTKQLRLELSGITTGTMRTLSSPNATGVIVLADNTATLTGKTYDTAGSGNVFKINGTTISTVTGTGAVALAVSPTFTGTVNVEALTASGVLTDSIGNVRRIVQNPQGAYTLQATDAGKHIAATGDILVSSGIFAVGDAITIYNATGGNLSVTQGGGVTLRMAGTSSTGTRTLAQRGVTTLLCVASNDFVVAGAGLS